MTVTMFTFTRLLATLGALVVVPTIAYVFGETADTPPPQPPAPIEQKMPNNSGQFGDMGRPQDGDQFRGGPNNGQFQEFPRQGQMGGGQGGFPGGNGGPGMMGGQGGFQGGNNGQFGEFPGQGKFC